MNTGSVLLALSLLAAAPVPAPTAPAASAGTAALAPAPAVPEAKATTPTASSPSPAPSTPVDYGALREQAAAKPGYSGYGAALAEKMVLDQFDAAWQDRPLNALVEIKPFLDEHPYSIAANRIVAEAFEVILARETDAGTLDIARTNAPRYRAAYEGLMRSLLASGDGRTCESAWHVITIAEEYETLRYLHLAESDQALFQQDDRVCDLFTAKGADGTERRVYFDVGAFFGKD